MKDTPHLDAADPRAGLAPSMRLRIAVLAAVQGVIWGSHAWLYEDLIFPDLEYALPYRLAQLAHCLGLLWLASRPRPTKTLEWGCTLLFVGILPIHGLAMLVVSDACFVPFLLTMEWGQGIIALAALLSYRPALVLFSVAWCTGVATVLTRPGFDPDLSDHVVLLLIYMVVAAAIRSQDRLRTSELEARTQLAAIQRTQALADQREEFLGELHDGVSAALARASLLLEASERAPVETKRRTLVEKAQTAVEGALAEARALLTLRDKPNVTTSVTALAIESALREPAQGFGVTVALSTESADDVEALPAALHHALCRLASEAATNAIRHGRATRIDASLVIDRERVSLSIRNDVTEGAPDDQRKLRSTGFGLRAAKRRLQRLRGELRAGPSDDSRGERAWLVSVTVPRGEAAASDPSERPIAKPARDASERAA